MKPSTIAAINIETGRAHVKHGQSFEQASDDAKLRMLVEEVGKIARALQDVDSTEDAFINATQDGDHDAVAATQEAHLAARDHLRAEITQVASRAARWLDAMGGDNG